MSASEGSEKVFEAVRLTERTFTTRPRERKGAIRARCLHFVDYLNQRGYEKLTVDQAKDLFSFAVDYWDRLTLKAYFGSQRGHTERVIDRTATYASGTVSRKIIRLRQNVPERKGYLERLGLVAYEWNSQTRSWFLVVNRECTLVPEIARMGTSVKEVCVRSITNLSLTPKHSGEQQDDETNGVDVSVVNDDREERECHRMRDKIFGASTPTQQLTPPEQTIFNAKPCEKEPDRAKIQWPRVSKDPGG